MPSRTCRTCGGPLRWGSRCQACVVAFTVGILSALGLGLGAWLTGWWW